MRRPRNSPRPGDPTTSRQARILRTLGGTVFLCGVALALIGIVSFYRTFGEGVGRYSWCAFIGLAMLLTGAKVFQAGTALD